MAFVSVFRKVEAINFFLISHIPKFLKYSYTAWNVSKYGAFCGPNTGKYGPEKTPYLDIFYAVLIKSIFKKIYLLDLLD